MFKRFLRLYPPFFLSVLLTLILLYISARVPGFRGPQPDWPVKHLVVNALLLGDLLEVPWILSVVWTLAIEFQYYLIAGLFPPFLRRGIFPSLGLVSLLLALSWVPFGQGTIFRFLPLFSIGVLALLFREKRIGNSLFIACMMIAGLVCVERLGLSQMLAGIGTGLAIAFVRGRIAFPMVWLGTVSYSFYLLHVPLGVRMVLLAQRLGLDSLTTKIAAVLVGVVLSVICAWIFYRLVEIPSHRMAQRIRYKGAKLKQ